MADPVLTFEVALASAPGDPAPTWTDLSVYLRSATTRRGRSRDLERYSAGEAEFVLGNEDRRFDPAYAAGPYYGNVVPMKRVRLTAVYSAVTYPIFDGYVDSWEQVYQHPQEALVVVKCTDAFKVLAATELPSSAYVIEVTATAPVAWWRLGDAQGSIVRDAIAAIPGTAVGATFGQQGLVARDADTAVTFTSTGGISVTDSRPQIVGSVTAFTYEAVIKTTAAGTQVIIQQDGTDSCQLRLRMLGTGILEFQVTDAGSAYTAETESTGAVNDGSVHHVVASFSLANGLRVWVDGANVSNIVLTDTGTPVLTASRITLGNDKALVVNGWTGTLDEVAIYDRELSAAEIAAHAAQVSTPWNNDSPGARAARILDYIAWPAGLRDLDTGKSVLQSATLATTALEHLQKVAESEFGALFISRDGKVTLVERDALVNQASQAAFGDVDPEWEYTALDFDYSDADIRNDVIVSRSEGTAQRVQDTASIAAYLRHSFTLDGLLYDSDELSRSAAEFFVGLSKDPRLRVTQLRLDPVDGSNAALFAEALKRELAEWVTVRRRPQNLGAAIDQVCELEGIDHVLGPRLWVTTFRLAPARAPAGGGCFIEFDDGAGSAPCGFDDFAFAL